MCEVSLPCPAPAQRSRTSLKLVAAVALLVREAFSVRSFSCQAHDEVLGNLSDPRFDFLSSLKHVKLQIGVSPFSPFATVNESLPSGVGPKLRFGGPAVVLLTRMAAEHGAELELEAVRPFDLTKERVSDYILEHVHRYDLLVGPFLDLHERRRRGLAFTAKVVDFSLQLYMLRPEPRKPGVWDNAFFWVRPFDTSGYMVVLLVWVVPSLLLWKIDADMSQNISGAAFALWRGFMTIVGIKGAILHWKPRHWHGRIVEALWALLVLVLTYLYLGHLMRNLIMEESVQAPVQNLDEFAVKGLTLCISHNLAMQRLAQQFFAGERLLPLPKWDLPAAVVEGRCQGFLERAMIGQVMLAGGQPQTSPTNGKPPYGCRLMPVGRPIVQLDAAYASTRRDCKGLVADVVSAWILDKKEDATIHRMMQHTVGETSRASGNGEPACPVPAQGAGGRQVCAEHLLGLVSVTLLPMLFAFASAWRRLHSMPTEGKIVLDVEALRRRNAELEAALATHVGALAALLPPKFASATTCTSTILGKAKPA